MTSAAEATRTRATVEEVVEKLQLLPHPEGGFFKETFRDETVHLQLEQLPKTEPFGFKVGRPISTAIYFLVPSTCVSRLHRIPSQEVWHFYAGDPLTVLEISDSSGAVKTTVLGSDLLAGETPQHVVPAGVWFGSFPTRDFTDQGQDISSSRRDGDESSRYSLVGCTVAPAFEFADFELAKRDELLLKFPHAQAFITALTDP